MSDRINTENGHYNFRLFAGCGCVTLLAAVLLLSIFTLSLYYDRHAGRYPGSEEVSRHDNYTRLPNEVRWDNTYLIADADFRTAYRWYSIKFDLGSEARAMERCVLMEGTQDWFWFQRYTGILLCDTNEGRMAFVNRTTYIK